MTSLGMCALFYSVTTQIEDETGSPKKVNRSVSSSPNLYSLVPSPKQTLQRMLFGIHAKTKRSLAEEAESGDDLSVDSWIKDGVDPNEVDSYGYTPLINASTLGRLQAVKELVKNGADVNKCGPFGFSALHAAARNGHREVVTYLLRNGADINAQNQDNDTPMHLALRAQKIEIVYQLMSSGGNSRIKGYNKQDSIECAKECGFNDLVKVLTNYSVFYETQNLHQANNFNRTISAF